MRGQQERPRPRTYVAHARTRHNRYHVKSQKVGGLAVSRAAQNSSGKGGARASLHIADARTSRCVLVLSAIVCRAARLASEPRAANGNVSLLFVHANAADRGTRAEDGVQPAAQPCIVLRGASDDDNSYVRTTVSTLWRCTKTLQLPDVRKRLRGARSLSV